MSLSNVSSSNDPTSSALPLGSSHHASSVQPGTPLFQDRRKASVRDANQSERRQFGDSHSGLSEAGRELAFAIDRYKLQHHRRYLTCDELLRVLTQLGYARQSPSAGE